MTTPFPLSIRNAFEALPDEASHIATNAPSWAEVFTPKDHQGALDPNRTVVVGDRGTGKSFWSSILVNDDIKNLVSNSYPRLELGKVRGQLGFSNAEMVADHPSRSEISAIMDAGYSSEDLWRAVLLRLAPLSIAGLPDISRGWEKVVAWVAADPGRRNAQFRALDQTLAQVDQVYVLVFDALDVIADNWAGIRMQIEGLIKLALSVRALKAIRLKLFIRPDMADDRRLWEVGDASKLRHRQVMLSWKRRDLYGLLWTLLANAQGRNEQASAIFRDHCAKNFRVSFNQLDGSWRPPAVLVEDEDVQQNIFRALAGNYMGARLTKGDTYKWVTNHLSDAAGFAAPRSFLLAMKKGVDETKSNNLVLDKNGIEAGVRDASRIRVSELSEDYRWMNTVIEDMRSLVVPLAVGDLISRWKQEKTLAKLRTLAADSASDRRFIPPGEVLQAQTDAEAYHLLVDQLVKLRIFFLLTDGRINMPDLFRLQADVKRKGGMRPRA